MAAIVFTAVAKAAAASLPAFGQAIIATAATAAGAYLDQSFVYPAIFGEPDVDDRRGSAVDDFGVQAASEGSPVRRCNGPENRVTGTVIWLDRKTDGNGIQAVESVEEVSGGGKGGGGGANVSTWSYFRNGAVGICEGEIESIRQIWAEGKILYDADAGSNFTSTQISCQNNDTRRYNPWTRTYTITLYSMVLKSLTSAGAPDLTELVAGKNATVSGFTNTQNNGTGQVLSTWKDTAGDSYAWIQLGPPSTVTEAAGNSITITQTIPFFDSAKLGGVTFYQGTSTQNPDPLIVGLEGTGNVPAWRNYAYAVFEKLALGPFGNRWPNMQFRVREVPTKSVGEAIGTILERAGYSSSEYDVTKATANFRGYSARGVNDTIQDLVPIMSAHAIVAQDVNGVLTFKARDQVDELTIPAGDLEAHRPGDGDVPRPIEMRRNWPGSLPTTVRVRYIDPGQDWQRGDQPYKHPGVDTPYDVDVTLDVTLTAEEALKVARRILWNRWVNRPVRLTLPPSYVHILEGDALNVTALGDTWKILVHERTEGQNDVIEIEGTVEQSQTMELQP